MYLEIADKEYNGYKYQQVNKKDLIDTIEAICRFENLRWFVLDIYDTTNIISKLAYVCQLNGVYTFDFEDITPFTEMDKEYMPLLADLLKEHQKYNSGASKIQLGGSKSAIRGRRKSAPKIQHRGS